MRVYIDLDLYQCQTAYNIKPYRIELTSVYCGSCIHIYKRHYYIIAVVYRLWEMIKRDRRRSSTVDGLPLTLPLICSDVLDPISCNTWRWTMDHVYNIIHLLDGTKEELCWGLYIILSANFFFYLLLLFHGKTVGQFNYYKRQKIMIF